MDWQSSLTSFTKIPIELYKSKFSLLIELELCRKRPSQAFRRELINLQETAYNLGVQLEEQRYYTELNCKSEYASAC